MVCVRGLYQQEFRHLNSQNQSLHLKTDWLDEKRLADNTDGELDSELDRVMICGSMEMLLDHKRICESLGMNEGSNSEPGHFVVEKAFVD